MTSSVQRPLHWAFRAMLVALALCVGLLIGTGIRVAYLGIRSDLAPKIAWCTQGADCVTKVCPSHRRTIVVFTATWCTEACGKLDGILENYEVRERLSGYGAIKADADRDQILALSYGVHSYPTTIIVDSHGRFVARATGVEDAYMFLGFLDGVEAARK